MTTLSIENLREHLDELEALLKAGEGILVTRDDKPLAQIVPIGGKRPLPSHKALRDSMPYQEIPSAVFIREDRDAR